MRKKNLSVLILSAVLTATFAFTGCTNAPTSSVVTPTGATASTNAPTKEPTNAPTETPTEVPTEFPTITPTPTPKPTATPTPTETPKAVQGDVLVKQVANICDITIEAPATTYNEALENKGILPKYLTLSDSTKTIARKDAFVILANAAKYVGVEQKADIEQIAKDYGYLVDISKLTQEQQDAIYYLYATGIVEGEMEGWYLRGRKIQPNEALSEADLSLYLNRIAGKEAKRVLSWDAQVTRTSTIKNIDIYPYVLDSIPDAYYMPSLCYMLWEDQKGGYLYNNGLLGENGQGMFTSPALLRQLNGINYLYNTMLEKEIKMVGNLAFEKEVETFLEEYLYKVFNVDYRTLEKDVEWKEFMSELTHRQISNTTFAENILYSYYEGIKQNHTIVECDLVRADTSTLYYDNATKEYYVRAYVHYRIVSADKTEEYDHLVKINGLDEDGDGESDTLIISPLLYHCYYDGNVSHVGLDNVVLGKWREGYFDIPLDYFRTVTDAETPGITNFNMKYDDYPTTLPITKWRNTRSN